ncbi:MAG: hypothetical protein N4A33_09455 [Bacteriovoracaceae bacterium]|jgi:cell division protein FtsB|nr:hypothetical protein [Bacteriovoracaceae bacterium]
MTRRRTTKKKESFFSSFLNQYILTSQTFPLILVLSVIGILFVLTRMKGVEQDYKYTEVLKKLKVEQVENKELKAKRASLLSVKKLKGFAKKYNLKEPTDKQIIVIP